MFNQLFRYCFPYADQQTFTARGRLWLESRIPITYQQALGLCDLQFRHYLRHPVLTEAEVRQLAAQGAVSEDAFCAIQLWYLDGHMEDAWLSIPQEDDAGVYADLFLSRNHQDAEHLQFYVTS